MSKCKTHIVLNPAAAGGKAGENKAEIIAEISRQLGNGFEVSETLGRNDAAMITSEAISAGCELIVAVGGDGTVSQVFNGFLLNGAMEDRRKRVGIISIGTGQGFAQSIGLPADLRSQIRLIRNNFTRPVDAGKICFGNGQTPEYFVNEMQLGIGGTLCRNTSPGIKRFLGRFSYSFEAVRTLLDFEACDIDMKSDECSFSGKVIDVVIANGACTGGGMRLTPDASPDDGLFDVLVIEDMPVIKRLRSFSLVYSGKHTGMPSFISFKTGRITFRCGKNMDAEADGELIADKCISAEVIPSAIRVISNNGRY